MDFDKYRIGLLITEEIRRKYGVINIIEKVREARLRWHGHLERKDAAELVRSIMEMEIKGNRG